MQSGIMQSSDQQQTLHAQQAVLFTHQEYGMRMLFPELVVNTRDERGKLGVRLHRPGVPANLVIKTQFKVEQANGELILKTVYMNRNSLRKYLMALNPQLNLTDKSSKQDLEAALLDTLINAKSNRPAEYDGVHHAGNHHQHVLKTQPGTLLDKPRGKFLSWLYQVTIGKLSNLRKRFLFGRTEKAYDNISEILAKHQYESARNDVPAYQAHVANAQPVKFEDVPETSKKTYIEPNIERDETLHHGGKYPSHYQKDTSTGTTGIPTAWVRSHEEANTVIKSLRVMSEIELGARRKNYINAFALGIWATGMTSYAMMRETGDVFATGPNKEAILRHLESHYGSQERTLALLVDTLIRTTPELGAHRTWLIDTAREVVNSKLDNKKVNINKHLSILIREKFSEDQDANSILNKNVIIRKIKHMVNQVNTERSQYILCGYPPFLKELVDFAASQNIDFKKYHVRGVVGGQSISEGLREQLINSGFSHINSSYGASDCDINIGVETEFEVKLRKLLESNSAIAEEIYGKNKGVPMVFHYDPYNYHIESNKNEELLYTCNRSDRSSPRIRYNLGDKGRVFAASDIEAILAKHGIHDLKPSINFPFLFVWGRDSAVAYRGAKVSFNDLEHAITKVDREDRYAKRALYAFEDKKGNDHFEIWLELKEGKALPDVATSKELLRALLVEMTGINPDLKSQLKFDDENAILPTIRIFTKGNSPISDASGHRKQVLVYNNKNIPADYNLSNAEATGGCTGIIALRDHEVAPVTEKGKEEVVNLTAKL